MTSRQILIINISLFLTTSCLKKTEVSGTVYSSQMVPVPNATLTIWVFKGSSYPSKSRIGGTTDQDGKYSITTRTGVNRGYKIYAKKDSASGLSDYFYNTKHETIDIVID